jgi:uncharacterized protein YbjT (DUF2867 family)
MKVLVTGATGFTGSYTVPMLLEQGIEVHCFARSGSDRSRLPAVEWAEGDLADTDSLYKALLGVDALVNIASLGFGHAEGIVTAAQNAGVKRAVFLSTTAIFTKLNAPSKRVRMAAEQAVVASGLDYTILRPTMIYGSLRDRNMCRLIRYIQRMNIIPIAGNGRYLQQPVFVADVAQAIVKSLSSPNTSSKAYNISGATVLAYNDVIDTICQLSGKSIIKLHLPVKPIVYTLQVFERTPIHLPVKAEQLERLNEDKVFSFDQAANDFSYQPRAFADGIQLELKEMGIR